MPPRPKETRNKEASNKIADRHAIARADEQVSVRNAVGLWAEQNTRPEANDREDRVKEKIQVVSGFLAFVGKHPGEVTPLDVRAWRTHLEQRGHRSASVYARISRVSSFYRWLPLEDSCYCGGGCVRS